MLNRGSVVSILAIWNGEVETDRIEWIGKIKIKENEP